MICKKCGHEIVMQAKFCPSCGEIQQNDKKKHLKIGLLTGLVIALIGIVGTLYANSLKSPIRRISITVYTQGQQYVEKMNSLKVKEKVAEYVQENEFAQLDDIHKNMDEIGFDITLDQNATEEEKYYVSLVQEFWRAKTICYAHEALIDEYQESEENTILMAASTYKGIVSDFEDQIDEAEEKFGNAKTMGDLQDIREILDNIWNEGEAD